MWVHKCIGGGLNASRKLFWLLGDGKSYILVGTDNTMPKKV